MRLHPIAAGIFVVALGASTALAQNTTSPPPKPTAAADTAPRLAGSHWRSSKLIGVNVYNEQNEKLGDINEVILDPTGRVMGYVIGVGGFLGMGEHDILVEPAKIKFVNEPVRTTKTSTNTTPAGAPTNTRNASATANDRWYPDHGILNATKDQLKAMAQFKY